MSEKYSLPMTKRPKTKEKIMNDRELKEKRLYDERVMLEKAYANCHPWAEIQYYHDDHAIGLIPSAYLHDPINSDRDSDLLRKPLGLRFQYSMHKCWVLRRNGDILIERDIPNFREKTLTKQRLIERMMILEAAAMPQVNDDSDSTEPWDW